MAARGLQCGNEVDVDYPRHFFSSCASWWLTQIFRHAGRESSAHRNRQSPKTHARLAKKAEQRTDGDGPGTRPVRPVEPEKPWTAVGTSLAEQ